MILDLLSKRGPLTLHQIFAYKVIPMTSVFRVLNNLKCKVKNPEIFWNNTNEPELFHLIERIHHNVQRTQHSAVQNKQEDQLPTCLIGPSPLDLAGEPKQ